MAALMLCVFSVAWWLVLCRQLPTGDHEVSSTGSAAQAKEFVPLLPH
jgi:hypothetical protein